MNKKSKSSTKRKTKTTLILDNAVLDDKRRYEATSRELNRKLGILKSSFFKLETENEQLQTQFQTLYEDRNDIINYLEHTVTVKHAEVQQLRENMLKIELERFKNSENCKSKIKEAKTEYKIMCNQLTSTIELLQSRLNSLEEAKLVKEDLMKKFEIQFIEKQDQKSKYAEELYVSGKKFVLEKDRLKREMKTRLEILSNDFQSIAEMRIAANTRNFVKKNVSVYNKYKGIIKINKPLQIENVSLKDTNKILDLKAVIMKEKNDKVMSKLRAQLKVVENLSESYEAISKKIRGYKIIESEKNKLADELRCLNNKLEQLEQEIKLLQQNLHVSRCNRNVLGTKIKYLQVEQNRLLMTVSHCCVLIQSFLQKPVSKQSLAIKHTELLEKICLIINEDKKEKREGPLLKTIVPLSMMYDNSSLGFVPKPVHLILQKKQNKEVIMGPSFEKIFEEYIATKEEEILPIE